MQTKEEVLQNCTVEGTVIKLPQGQLDRKLYVDVANSLQLIGGKWKGGKIFGFVFENDPTELLEQIANGEKRNLKKEFQFFATPDALADRLVEIADIQPTDEPPMILEPSAGQGAIVKAINRSTGGCDVYCYELMPTNQKILSKISTVVLLGGDFLQHEGEKFDYIIANPPFSKNQDIDHIKKMYEVLAANGRMVTIASKHWQISSNKKETEFKAWLQSVNADVEDIDAGEFKESGTMVAGVIITITK